jgi:hypothetical protein
VIWWLMGGYALVWLAAIPAMVNWWMGWDVCRSCGNTFARQVSWWHGERISYCGRSGGGDRHGRRGWAERGELRARRLRNALAALLLAVFWPVWLAFLFVDYALWRGLARPALRLVLRAPLTPPERARRAAEQAKRIEENNREIARQMREIEEAS